MCQAQALTHQSLKSINSESIFYRQALTPEQHSGLQAGTDSQTTRARRSLFQAQARIIQATETTHSPMSFPTTETVATSSSSSLAWILSWGVRRQWSTDALHLDPALMFYLATSGTLRTLKNLQEAVQQALSSAPDLTLSLNYQLWPDNYQRLECPISTRIETRRLL